ncbi:degv family protein [hydrocarbon metagenome]|uniref:Degv family protein n=1 Tax=hydrocarbon metagenome TaxID=938273 RepID=A0A0W8E7J8_9ZZZZ
MKEKIALLTDSMCDLPNDLAKKFNVKVLPAKVIYPDREYSDRIDIQPEEVYSRMPEEIPTTSFPSLDEIKQALNEIRSEGFTHVLAVHISSGLSGTFNAVEFICRDVQDLTIKVIDSKTLSMGTGWLVLDAARSITNGLSFEKVIERVNKLQESVRVYYILETLEYLRRGGRIGKVAAVLGEFLHLKPVISVGEDGKYYTYCKAKGRKKSIEKLVQIIEEATANKQINLALVHGGAQEECQKLAERLQKLPNIKEFMSSDISPVLGVHTGPGLLGVCFHEV